MRDAAEAAQRLAAGGLVGMGGTPEGYTGPGSRDAAVTTPGDLVPSRTRPSGTMVANGSRRPARTATRTLRGTTMSRTIAALTAMILLLAACGQSADDDVAGSGDASATTDAEADDAADDEEADPTPDGPDAATGTDLGDLDPATIRLYSTITQETIDEVVAAFADAAPQIDVEVVRAPTGELTARIATEERQGRIRGDALWLTDPLTALEYEARDVLQVWEPANAADLPPEYRTVASFGARLSQLVIVHDPELDTPPASWDDLATVDGTVAVPDPAFAGSAFAALGWFGLEDAYGMAYYGRLAAAGAVQVASPGDVISGVAEGRFAAGLTLDFLAADAIAAGSPLTLVWPEPGAITVFSPAAVFTDAEAADAARAFVEFLLGPDGQAAVAASGVQPVRAESGGPAPPPDAPLVSPDWEQAFARQAELLEDYERILGP
jgi:iron(III) transport system substrate-binding protein